MGFLARGVSADPFHGRCRPDTFWFNPPRSPRPACPSSKWWVAATVMPRLSGKATGIPA
jgi:hypothetical protein